MTVRKGPLSVDAIFQADRAAVCGCRSIAPSADDDVEMGAVLKHLAQSPVNKVSRVGFIARMYVAPHTPAHIAAAGARAKVFALNGLDA